MKQLFAILILNFITMSSCMSQNSNRTNSNIFSGEPDTLIAKKIKCDCVSQGSNLVVMESSLKEGNLCSPFQYSFLYSAKDRSKVKLIKALLSYSNDESVSCMTVKCYDKKSFQKYGNSFRDLKLTTQIMALYHINLICFGQYAVFMYSPYPVLYDTLDKKVINNDPQRVAEVYLIYKNWVNTNSNNGFTNFNFPLLDSRYIWIHGDQTKDIKFKSLPKIKSDYKRRIGVPVDQ